MLTCLLGIGLSAKAVENGGCDLILVYNSGRFRMAGRGSLAGLMPYSDANQVVVEMVYLHKLFLSFNG
jgi:predicted TIM-barrel enzyme